MNKQLLWRMLEGKVINNQYHLNKLLGAGGYGGVFLADDVIRDKLIRKVAIKLIISDNHNDGQLDEIIAATNLQHPNLIRCFYGSECSLNGADFLYLVMEVADFSLEKRLTKSILSETETTLLVQDITEALVYLHNQPKAIVHRDLKPGNVLRVGDKWKLSDLGLVKIINAGSISNTSKLFGTAQYVPPESYDGEISPAWDVWSLGIIIVEALTGKPPFQGETEQQLQKQICEKEPDLSGLPQKFEPIVRGCLEKDRKKRWTAKQVLDKISRNTKPSKDIATYNKNSGSDIANWLVRFCMISSLSLLSIYIVSVKLKELRPSGIYEKELRPSGIYEKELHLIGIYEGEALNTTGNQRGKILIEIFNINTVSGQVEGRLAFSKGLFAEGNLTGKIENNQEIRLHGTISSTETGTFETDLQFKFSGNQVNGKYTLRGISNPVGVAKIQYGIFTSSRK